MYFYNINNKDHTFPLAANKLFPKKRGKMIERMVLGGKKMEIES